MEEAKLIVSVAAVLLSLASFGIAQRSAVKAKRAEAITHLLGGKETVAYAALKMLRDGLPANRKERKLVLAALLQACVFEGSDRARALLYRVIEENRSAHREEFREAAKAMRETFDSMDRYQFNQEELDLARGRRRLAVASKVIETP